MSDIQKVVYVVDDDEAVRRSVGFMLKTSGYAVHSFANGADLLKQAKTLEPGCLLSISACPEWTASRCRTR